MRRTLTLVSVLALMMSLLALPALADTTYTGNGMSGEGPGTVYCGDDIDLGQGSWNDAWGDIDEEGYLKWVWTGDPADPPPTTLYGPWGAVEMTQAGGGAWHAVTPYYDLADLLGGAVHVNASDGLLTVSNGCPGDGDEPIEPEGIITVEKTAETTYVREHFWDIDKSVDTENGYEHNELPKVWLYTDGSGDETATWTVDVTYEGYEDSGWTVYGEITVTVAGDAAVSLDSVSDVIDNGAAEIAAAVVCDGVTFPYRMEPGDELTCSYSALVGSALPGTNIAVAAGTFLYSELPSPTYVPTEDASFSENGTAGFSFGDPDEEINETVNVKDISDLFGEVDLGSVTAPNGYSFTYDKDFAYADFDECGDYGYDNTASIVETDQEADASLLVNVQCMVFNGETVTGAGDPWSAIGARPRERTNTWFEYTVLSLTGGDVQTFDLVQGRKLNDVGDVTITLQGDGTTLLEFTLDDPWELDDVASNVKVQPLSAKPTSYLAPGSFDYHFDREGSSFSVVVPTPSPAYGYAIHLDAGYWMPDPNFGP